jgi:hypothetical protein
MSWFRAGRLQNKTDTWESLIQEDRDAGSPIEWEVLSQGDRAQEVEIPGGEEDGSVSEDESLTIIEGEDDMENQVKALQKHLVVAQREKQSLEERLRQRENAAEGFKETSNRIAARLRSELNEAHQEIEKSKREMDTVERKMSSLRDEMKALTEEAHQAQVRARLEVKGTRLALDEKSQQMTKSERDNEELAFELKLARERIDKLTPETKSLKETLTRKQELNDVLEEQLHSLKTEVQLLKDESSRVTAQNSQVLAMLGVRSLERGETDAFTTTPDLVSDAEVVKTLEQLNAEIFEASAYMADSFVFALKPASTDEVREAFSRTSKMLGSKMVLSLTSVRHDEDPLIVQIACQACMVECSRRIIASWCFDGSKTEDVLPDLYGRIRKAEAHAGGVSGRWRALTRTLVRSMLHGQTVDVSSRLIPLISDAIVDALLVAGCQGTRTQVHGQLTQRFRKKIAVIVTMALRLNEVIGEEITSCELKAISMPYGVAFSPRTMDDGYDDGKWHGLASESPLVLCTTELGLQKEVKGYDGGWQRMVLTKPKVSLESLTNDMELRQ